MEFLKKYKKIFIGFIFAVIVIILGYLLYVTFFKPSRLPADKGRPKATSTTSSGGLPSAQTGQGLIVQPGTGLGGLTPAGGGKIQASPIARGGLTETSGLNQSPGLGATLSANGQDLFYYNRQDGKFYRINRDGQSSELSGAVFHEVKKITWSPDKNKAILEYPDQAKIIYDFQNKKQVSLPKHWQDFDFSPDGSKMVMKSLAEAEDNRWLAVVSDQGAGAIKIAALGNNADAVLPSWSPNNQTVAMFTEGAGFDRQNVFFVGLNNENFKALSIEGRGFEPKWSPRGDRLLYSVYTSENGLKPELWVANAQGENIGSGREKLGIQTWADKCAFATNAEIYCAVPQELEEGAGLFPELANNTRDNLYKIDAQTGLKRLIAVPDGEYTMSNLIIADNGGYLYFTDANTGRINRIKLK